ncbi:MAG: hypothetical protein JSW34_03850, partial [Candidatus Zixiibacteriota bacterium]
RTSAEIIRGNFPTFSVAALSHRRTPEAFKPTHLNSASKHIYTDGFIRDKQAFLIEASATDHSAYPLNLTGHNGIYNIVVYDESSGGLTILNDRHGARYLYYYEDDDSFIFAPNPKVILASGLVRNRTLDYRAVISLLSHEYIMSNRSLVESIRLLPFASHLELNGSRRKITRYWNFDSLSTPKLSDKYEDLVEQGGRLLKDAIESYALEDAEIIIPLSGGLDSRTIASFLSGKADCRAIHIDYGFEKKLARKVAAKLNLDLEISPRRAYQLYRVIDPFIICAIHSVHQFWVYPHLQNKINRGFGTLIVDGYLMNEVIGGLSTLGAGGYSDMNRRFPPLNKVFDFVFGPKIRDVYFTDHDDQIAEIIAGCPSDRDYDKYLYFTMLNYGRRFTLLFSVIHQYLASVGLPVLDYRLLDFCLRVPFEVKVSSRLYRDMVASAFPEIGKIPWSRNRLPLTSPKDRHFICKYLDKLNMAKYYLSRLTQGRIETLPRHNKDRNFRKIKDCRDYFMYIVFDDRTFDKGYVSKSGLEKIVQLTDTGRNYFEILEKVAIIELVSRELDLTS